MSLVHDLPKIIDIINLGPNKSIYYVEGMNDTCIHVYISSGTLYLDITFEISIINNSKKIIGTVGGRPSYFDYLLNGMKDEIEQLERNINNGKYDTIC
jgi:hypothetical protein